MLGAHQRAELARCYESRFNRFRESIVDFLASCIAREVKSFHCSIFILTNQERGVLFKLVKAWQIFAITLTLQTSLGRVTAEFHRAFYIKSLTSLLDY